MPVDFEPLAEPAKKKIDFTPIDFEPLETPRKSNEQLRAEMAQVEAERPKGIGAFLSNNPVVEDLVYGASPQGLADAAGRAMKGVGALGAGAINKSLDLSARAQGLPAYEKPLLELGKSPVALVDPSDQSSPLKTALLRTVEGFLTPESMFSLPFALGTSIPARVAQGAFATQMAQGAGQGVATALNPEVDPFERKVAGIEAAIGGGLGGLLARGAAKGPAPKRMETLAQHEGFTTPRISDYIYSEPVKILPSEKKLFSAKDALDVQEGRAQMGPPPAPKKTFTPLPIINETPGRVKEIVIEGQGKVEVPADRIISPEGSVEVAPGRKVEVPPEEGSIGSGIKAALEKNEGEAGAVTLPTRQEIGEGLSKAMAGARKLAEPVSDFVERYAAAVPERLKGIGGATTEESIKTGLKIQDRAKQVQGELGPLVDAAKAVTRHNDAPNRWLRGGVDVTPHTRFSNLFGALEKDVRSRPTAETQKVLDEWSKANLAIGKVLEPVTPGFKASGLPQRMLTPDGVNFLMSDPVAKKRWSEGVAKLNGKTPAFALKMLDSFGKDLSEAGVDGARLDRIAQDFARELPRTITHVKVGGRWHALVETDPFKYMDAASHKAAYARAFRESFPLGSDKLQKLRDQVHNELADKTDITKFDDMVTALQGHSLDKSLYTSSRNARAIRNVVSTLKALNLSASAVSNLAELMQGAPQIVLGNKNTLRGLLIWARNPTALDTLRDMGVRDKMMYNWAWDKNSVSESLARITNNGVRKLTGQNALNELQETMSGFAALAVKERLVAKEVGKMEQGRIKNVFRAMGFDEAMAQKMIDGDVAALDQFVRKAPSWLSGGNVGRAELSRWGASQTFNDLFWYHRYPMTTLNQSRAFMRNFLDDSQKWMESGFKDKEARSQMGHSLVNLSRQAVGRSAQGLLMTGVLAGFTGAHYGLQNWREETKDKAMTEPFSFVSQLYVSAMGGPAAVLQRLAKGEDISSFVTGVSKPASYFLELYDLGMSKGKYEGMDYVEKLGKFLESNTPASRGIRTAAALTQLSQRDEKLQVATKAFYRWAQDQPGFKRGGFKGKEENAEFRHLMRGVLEKINNGGDWVAELGKLEELKKTQVDVADFLEAKTMLEIDGKPLTQEQEKALTERIGKEFVDRLRTRDAALREISSLLMQKTPQGERVKPADIKPEGNKAQFEDPAARRVERVRAALSPVALKAFDSSEVKDLDYDPNVDKANPRNPRRRIKLEPTVEEGKIMEAAYVEALNKMLSTWEQRGAKMNLKQRQQVLSEMKEKARLAAAAKVLRSRSEKGR